MSGGCFSLSANVGATNGRVRPLHPRDIFEQKVEEDLSSSEWKYHTGVRGCETPAYAVGAGV